MEDKVNTGNSAVEMAESNPAPAKKTNKSKAKSQEKKPATSEMVTAAIKELKDHKGSSLQAIKKYIVSTYKVDGEKVAPYIRRYLKTAVSSGAVVQTKGKGASGSFKLSTDNSKPKTKAQAKRPTKPASKKDKIEKTTTARKPAVAKKAAASPKKAAESPKKQPAQKKAAAAAKSVAKKKSGKAATETKAPSKAKKAVKAPAAKTKTPKPKKTATKAVAISAKK
ncbi:histone H1-like [Cataglyphis hispanica]|uniref:histone H1-like n=1 Tax=Cataglyphis hispanica TaxID=1086592 RepID=UPI0021802353|nr:histone H1-like [Cataglyphis hispanica]